MVFLNKNKKYTHKRSFSFFKKKRVLKTYNNPRYIGKRNFTRAQKNIWRILIIAFLIIIIWLLFFSPLFKIKEINITGNETISDNEINQAIKPIFEKRFYWIFSGDSIIFFNEKEAKDLLSKENFYFEEIKIEKKFPNSVKIEIKEKKAKLAWCQIIQKEILENSESEEKKPAYIASQNIAGRNEEEIENDNSEDKVIILEESQCYWIDKDGIVYSRTPAMEDLEISLNTQEKEKRIIILKEKNKELNEFAKLGDKVANPEFINFVLDAPQEFSKTTNLEVTDFETPGAVFREFHITVNEGWEIYFDTSGNIKSQINILADVLREEIEEEERENLEYIDLRIKNKVYYK